MRAPRGRRAGDGQEGGEHETPVGDAGVGARSCCSPRSVPSWAITGGEPDGNRHPNVAMIVFYQPDGRFRCSATLASPTVLITAAHCTDGVRGKTIVTFDTVAPLRRLERPTTPATARRRPASHRHRPGWLAGTPHAHPLWDGELQLNDLHDVGIVVLDAAVHRSDARHASAGGLPRRAGEWQRWASTSRRSRLWATGCSSRSPRRPAEAHSVADRTRRFTDAVGQNVSSQVLKLAENANDSRAGGGSCFGDSGGPVFHNGLLVGDTSFGASQFCRSAGGYYRLDTQTPARSSTTSSPCPDVRP